MGVMVIVAYRPKPGKAEALLQLTREHVAILRGEGLATERPVQAMRAKDGTIVEVFEWTSQSAIDSAHTNAAVGELWGRYSEACDYVPLKELKEAGDMFAAFEPIAL